MTTPQTRWIGGSYEAAVGFDVSAAMDAKARGMTAAAMDAKARGMTAAAILRYLRSFPGANIKVIAESLHLTPKSAKASLTRLRKNNEVHAFCDSHNGVGHPWNRWFPGPAPKQVNHVTKGRPRSVAQG